MPKARTLKGHLPPALCYARLAVGAVQAAVTASRSSRWHVMNHRTSVAQTVTRGAIVALATLFVCASPAFARTEPPCPSGDPWWLVPMKVWVMAVNSHAPGRVDDALGALVRPQLSDLQDILTDVLALSRHVSKRGPVEYRGCSFTAEQLRQVLGFREADTARTGTNRLLHRAAVYHADIGWAASRGDLKGTTANTGPGRRSQIVGDGQRVRTSTSSIHWEFGRELLDHLEPGPSRDPVARAWYEATGASLQVLKEQTLADEHLSRARQIFPDDAMILFRGACAIETLTSPTIQAALGRESVPRPRSAPDPPTFRSLLNQAEQLFRRALNRDSSLTEGKIRLARLTAEKGNHEEALGLLRRVLDENPANDLRYLALLFLGDAELATGRRIDARTHYEEAATLYHTAQAPLLALAMLARDNGDRAALADALDRLSRLPADARVRVDPWWTYYVSQGSDAGILMRRLYAILAEAEQ
jgi:tetratricopeptide (TPR) repeat protein